MSFLSFFFGTRGDRTKGINVSESTRSYTPTTTSHSLRKPDALEQRLLDAEADWEKWRDEFVQQRGLELYQERLIIMLSQPIVSRKAKRWRGKKQKRNLIIQFGKEAFREFLQSNPDKCLEVRLSEVEQDWDIELTDFDRLLSDKEDKRKAEHERSQQQLKDAREQQRQERWGRHADNYAAEQQLEAEHAERLG